METACIARNNETASHHVGFTNETGISLSANNVNKGTRKFISLLSKFQERTGVSLIVIMAAILGIVLAVAFPDTCILGI